MIAAALVFAAASLGLALCVLRAAVAHRRRTDTRIRAITSGRPVVTLEWVHDVPVATIEGGDPDAVFRWLDAVRQGVCIRA